MQPAERAPGALNTTILAAARAGARIVAVGQRGVVLLSDNDGKTYRQAMSVPVSSTLTSVWFIDASTGWSVGDWGAIIKSTDGGETWVAQRSDTQVDQPLFSVYFKNGKEGWAVGLWSLMLHTTDSGANWAVVKLLPPAGAKKADRNLYAMFADTKGNLFVACEQGRVMRSSDGGVSWNYVETGYAGSFWSGIALRDGTILVGGLRGKIYRSANGGDTWAAVPTPYASSITGMQQLPDQSIRMVGLEGVTLSSHDDGMSFTGYQRPDRKTLTAVIDTQKGHSVLFSVDGPTASQ
ncbi:glycosyl hydrolase [Glaciimonas sp. PCH181]|nr:glycosyl hydrolase [Glaciimonas sp. PCH181]